MAETYVVKKGDTLGKIGTALGIPWRDIYNLNKDLIGSDPNLIQIGMEFKLPGSEDGGDGGGDGESTAPGATTQALPRNSKLVKIGSSYRVIWDLGDNLGWAWYDITAQQLDEIYDTKTPAPHFTLSNAGQFEAQYGNNYWGNVGEISLKADTPWEDLSDRIFNQFGYVPGFDEPEIRRLLQQAYFENWDQNQWTVQYRGTEYYNKTTDDQRKWAGMSLAERDALIEQWGAELKTRYQDIWGHGFAIDEASIGDAAFKLASGQMSLNEWIYTTTEEASRDEGTLEFDRRRQEAEDLLAEGNEIENLTAFAEAQWRAWVGPVDMPASFANRWGSDLASGNASEADLESYLKEISTGRWGNKPPNLTWEDWAASYKSQIKRTLELGSLDDTDGLLNSILGQDLTGIDLDQLIRQDERFQSTRTMYNELSNMASEMGRRFGFIT